MAGIVYEAADVEKSLRDLVKLGLYGSDAVSSSIFANTSVQGSTFSVKVARGWPNGDDLQNNVAKHQGVALVSIVAPPICTTARCSLGRTLDIAQVAPTVFLMASGSSVTVSGQGAAGLACGVVQGSSSATYACQAGDTPTTIAAALAANLPNATIQGTTIQLAGQGEVYTAVGGDWTTITEFGRTQQRFRFSVWASDGPTRDAIVAAIRGVVDPLTCVPMPSGYAAEAPVPKGTPSYPMDQSAGVYRRDVDYDIIYPTYQVSTVPAILQVALQINNNDDGAGVSDII